MSLGADYMADYAYEIHHPFGVINTENPVWTTRDGHKLRVSDMTSAHIRNCMKFTYGCDWYDVFENELEKRKNYKSTSTR